MLKYNETNTEIEFKCPAGAEKEGAAESSSIVPASLAKEKDLKNCKLATSEKYNSK